MIKINILAVGKIKEPFLESAIKEYTKRLSRFCEITIKEIKEESFAKDDNASRQICIKKESERLKQEIKGYVFLNAIEGKKFTSEKFAEKLKQVSDEKGVITFIIGGSNGVSKELKESADTLLSFSDMTFPHQLFRVMLLEQIYRAFMINAGSDYHK